MRAVLFLSLDLRLENGLYEGENCPPTILVTWEELGCEQSLILLGLQFLEILLGFVVFASRFSG